MTYGCIGEHLPHSFSKIIHEKLGYYAYELKELTPEELPDFLTRREFSGINVTIPYKEAVIPFLDEIDEGARAIGAVNTVVNREGKLFGYNTDFAGLKALAEREGIDLADKKVLILGTGGTSKTAAAAAKAAGASSVKKVSRKPSGEAISYEEAARTCCDTEVLINTTPCGMYPVLEASPIDLSLFPSLTGLLDVIYNPLRTRLVLAAKERGIPAAGGLYMLVAQAVFAAEHFLGKPLDREVIETIYRELLCEKENIVLVGMPGCGKTTVGGLLSARMKRPLLDTDEEIVKKRGISIPEIFTSEGEFGFREEESEVIRTLAPQSGLVIATGGGAILRKENWEALRQNGRLYFLDRPLNDLTPTADRPLSSDREALRKRYEERYPLYRAATDSLVPVNGTPESAAQALEEEHLRRENSIQ